MLVSENQMTEGHGVLLFDAQHGLSFQIAGALARLGRRVLSLEAPAASVNSAPSKEIRYIPMQKIEVPKGKLPDWKDWEEKFKSFVWESSEVLSKNQDLGDAQWLQVLQLAQSFKQSGLDVHGTWILPNRSNVKKLAELKSILPGSTILLAPRAWGFEDQGLLDQSLELFNKRTGVLLKTLRSSDDLTSQEWVSFDDLAAQIVATLNQDTYKERMIRIEGQYFSLEEWRTEFVSSFKPEVDWFEKMAAKVSSELLSLDHTTLPPLENQFEDAEISPVLIIESSRNAFPTTSTPLARNLRTVANAFKRHPEMKQVFTPSRAL